MIMPNDITVIARNASDVVIQNDSWSVTLALAMTRLRHVMAIGLCFLVTSVMAMSDVIHVSQLHPTFSIDVPANATTGYSWVVGKHDAFIQLISSHYYPPTHTRLLGAPGRTVFQFKISAKAIRMKQQTTMNLDLIYQRPWNHELGSKRSYQIVLD